MMRLLRTPRRGTAATEFALWLPILAVLIAGVVDWGSYMNVRAGVTRAAIDGARVGASKFESATDTGGSVSGPAAETRARAVLTSLGMGCAAGCSVTATFCPRDTAGICDVTTGGGTLQPPVDALHVQVSYNFQPWFGFAFTPSNIAVDFVMAMENQRALATASPAGGGGGGGGGDDD